MSDIEKVKKLREVTGAGFKDCNLAIKESNGDVDKALDLISKAKKCGCNGVKFQSFKAERLVDKKAKK